MDIFSNREIATVIWSIIFLMWVITIKGIKLKIKNLIKSVFNKKIIFSFTTIIVYTTILVFISFKTKLNHYIDLKDIFLWALFSGVPLCYSAVTNELNKRYFLNILKNNLKLIIVIEFIIGTFTFSLIREILILPIFTCLFLLEIFSDREQKYKEVNKIISCIQTVSGFFILYKSFSIAINQYKELKHLELLVSFITPFIMSVLYLPMILAFGILTNYNNILYRIKIKLIFELRVLKTKVKNKKEFINNYCYRTQDVNSMSKGIAKWKTINVILNNDYDIKEIEDICIEQFCKYNYKSDVVWIYVATNSANYIINNWVMTAQWINPKLNKKLMPISISGKIKYGIHFKYNKSYLETEKYYKENIFQDDRELFINNMKLYDKIKVIYDLIYSYINLKEYKVTSTIFKKLGSEIEYISSKYSNIGISTNIEFETYLQQFQNYIALIENIKSITLDDSRDSKNIAYLLNSYSQDINLISTEIEKGKNIWMNKLNITKQEYKIAEFKK